MPSANNVLTRCLVLAGLLLCWPRLAWALSVTYDQTTFTIEATGLGNLTSYAGGDPNWDSICSLEHQICLVADLVDPQTKETRFPPGGVFSIALTPTATNGQGLHCYSDADDQSVCETFPAINASCGNFNWSASSTPCSTTRVRVGEALTQTATMTQEAMVPGNTNSFAGFYVSLMAYTPPDYMGQEIGVFQIWVIPDRFYGDNLVQTENRGTPADNPDTVFDGAGAGTCSAQGLPRSWVNTAGLNLVVEDTDFLWTSFGHAVALRRTWNQAAPSGMFGNGWAFAYESELRALPYGAGGASVRLGSGQRLEYAVASVQGQGTGQVTVTYASRNTGRRPQLTAVLDESSGIGVYRLTDKVRKRTASYAAAGFDAATGEYRYRLATVADRNGNTLTLTYDGQGNLTRLTDASGRYVTFTADDSGRVTGMTAFTGQSASYQYDGSGNLTQSVDLAGNVTSYAYDAEHDVTAMTTAGKTTTFTYAVSQGAKRVASVTDALNQATSYAMDDSRAVTVTDPGGGQRHFTSRSGRTASSDGAPGGPVTIVYNDAGLPTAVTRAGGAVTALAYDAAGNLIQVTDPTGAVTTLTYDNDWNPTGLTDPLGRLWSFTYDAKGNPTGETSPLGRVTTYSYDAKGNLARVTRPGGSQIVLTHDAHGNLSSLTDPTNRVTTFTYDNEGLNLWKLTDPRGNQRSFVHDANRRITRLNLPDSRSIQFGYDCCALSSFTDPGGNTTAMGRDALLRLTNLTDALGQVTSLAYAADGSPAAVTAPLNRTTNLSHDAAHRLSAVDDPLGNQTRFARDLRGNLASLTSPRGKTTTFGHDLADRLLTVTDPLGRTTASLTRDGLGRIASRTNGRGQTVAFERDADGRVIAKRHGSNTAASYGWSADGLLVSLADGWGNSVFTRDAAGRVTAMRYPDGTSLSLSYDAAGNLVSLGYPGSLTVTYAYDSRNRPIRADFAGQAIELAYDAAGNLATETRLNGVTSSYGYDAAGRLVAVSHVKGPATIANIAYTRNAAGEITKESGTWPLFPSLNNGSGTAGYTDADEVSDWKGDTYLYDEDGNLTAVSGARGLAADYDPENRLTSLTVAGSTRDYLYDGLGNRVRITEGAVTRNLHHDPWGRLLYETNASGAVTMFYVHVGPVLMALGTPTGGLRHLLRDKTGNCLALADASGTVVSRYAYSDYGLSAGRSGSDANASTFVGAFGVMEEGGDIYCMRNRFYDARTGRFLQRDPLGLSGGDANLYRYARSAPVSRIDPAGLADFEMTHFGWYDVNVAEGTYDLDTGQEPHMADPATDGELVAAGVIMATGLTGMAAMSLAAPAVCAAGETAVAAESGAEAWAARGLLDESVALMAENEDGYYTVKYLFDKLSRTPEGRNLLVRVHDLARAHITKAKPGFDWVFDNVSMLAGKMVSGPWCP